VVRGVRLQAEDRLQQVKDTPRGPGLGDVGPAILHRKCSRSSLDPGLEFQWPIAHEVAGRFGDIPEHAGGFRRKAVALEAEPDDAVVMGHTEPRW